MATEIMGKKRYILADEDTQKTVKYSRFKKTEDKQRHCISMYLTDGEYAELVEAKGDVTQSLFCKKIILASIRKKK